MVTRILSIVFLVVAVYLGYYLFDSIKSVIDEEKRIERVENRIIEKLKLIRDTQVAFQQVHGKYTSDWDSLISFLDSGTIYITEISEEIIQKEYGAEDVIRHVDTVGTQPAKEFVFTELNLLSAGDSGVITDMRIKEGDEITVNYHIYNLQTPEKLYKVKATYGGVITHLYVKKGDIVTRGQTIADVTKDKYPPDYDITRLPYVPGSNKKFEIFADEIERSGVTVDVFEVKDPDPINPERRQENEALRVGSRTDVTIAGNWE